MSGHTINGPASTRTGSPPIHGHNPAQPDRARTRGATTYGGSTRSRREPPACLRHPDPSDRRPGFADSSLRRTNPRSIPRHCRACHAGRMHSAISALPCRRSDCPRRLRYPAMVRTGHSSFPSGGKLPLGLGGQTAPRPLAVGHRLSPRQLGNWLLPVSACEIHARSVWALRRALIPIITKICLALAFRLQFQAVWPSLRRLSPHKCVASVGAPRPADDDTRTSGRGKCGASGVC